MGSSASKATVSANMPCKEVDAQALLRHLQEHEGYQVYDVFERGQGERVPAPVRIWLEAMDSTANTPGSGDDTDTLSTGNDSRGEAEAGVETTPWVVLSSPPPVQVRKARGSKAPPPPPAKRPPPPKAKAGNLLGTAPAKKAVTTAPPFGKRLHWKLLPSSAFGDTIFDDLKPWGEVIPPLDTQQLERLLAPPAAPVRDRTVSALGVADAVGIAQPARRNSGLAASTGAQGKVQLLNPKHAQNLAIILRQVALPTDELSEVLRWLRLSHPISADSLEHVYNNLLPPLLESSELLRYSGPPEALRDIERQLLPLVRLPRLKARLQTMLFSKSLPGLHASLSKRIQELRDACLQVRTSTALRRVFETVLRVGTYLNHGIDALDAGGGVEVRGFTVESLLKLRDFRAAQGSEVSALHCVVIHLLSLEATLPELLRAELRTVLLVSDGNAVTEGSIADLHDAVRRVHSEIDLVQGEIERFGDCYRLDGESADCQGPLAVLQRLVEDASEIASGLESSLVEALQAAWRLLEYFGEQRGSMPTGGWSEDAYASVERLFVTIREFAVSFEDCWREVVEQPRKFKLEASPRASVNASCGGGVSHGSSPKVRPLGATQSQLQHISREASGGASDRVDVVPALRPGGPPAGDSNIAMASCHGPTSGAQLAAEAAAAMRRRRARTSANEE